MGPSSSQLQDGRHPILGIWPKGVDARVTDAEHSWPVRYRQKLGWQCMCSTGWCAHQLAVTLVVGHTAVQAEAPPAIRTCMGRVGGLVRPSQRARDPVVNPHRGTVTGAETLRRGPRIVGRLRLTPAPRPAGQSDGRPPARRRPRRRRLRRVPLSGLARRADFDAFYLLWAMTLTVVRDHQQVEVADVP